MPDCPMPICGRSIWYLTPLIWTSPNCSPAAQRSALHPGQTARISREGRDIGYLGTLHPAAVKELGLGAPLFVCELDLGEVLQAMITEFSELSKFPEVRRDLFAHVGRSID